MRLRFKYVNSKFIHTKISLSLNKHEPNIYLLDFCKAWYRQIPVILYGLKIPITEQKDVQTLPPCPLKLSTIKDVRIFNNLLSLRSQMGINQTICKLTETHPTKPFILNSRNLSSPSQQGRAFDTDQALKSSSRVIWSAVIINGANFIAKSVAWLYTGSHSMFAEAVHSLADTGNQLILAVGIRKSIQSPTADHPYGYHPMRYIAPLISGVGIFCVGCGLSIYHGFEALLSTKPELFMSPYWAYGILSLSFVSESTTLIMAIRALKSGADTSNLSVREYIGGNSDPGLIVVLLEDVAAVMGIGIAASCMFLSNHYQTHVFDACGSLMIGTLLGAVATFIIKKNTIALVGKSIPRDTLNKMNHIIEKDILIRAIHDVKATDLGNGVVRYKAEVDVDGRELSKKYLEKMDLKNLLEDIRQINSEKDAQAFILTHGEGVVDLLGAEVDRIEKELRRYHPKVKHVDLEVL